mmetsp:Transcript_4782/g.6911  ORF Transcript_4782/g.6911 Transcript_4782/m.6911 type:complete len:295 (+) Transcript_4782:101-985(+)
MTPTSTKKLKATLTPRKKKQRDETIPKDYFSCTKCKRRFASRVEFMKHTRPWKCHTCGKSDFTTSQAFSGHSRCCYKLHNSSSAINESGIFRIKDGCKPSGMISLKLKCLQEEQKKLSDFNQMITDGCISLFEATSVDANFQIGRNRVADVREGDIGIRCTNCWIRNSAPPGSVIFPQEIKNLPHNVSNMVKRHLSSCLHIPMETRRELLHNKQFTTSQSMTKGRIGFPTYMKLLCEKLNLKNRVNREGVFRVHDNDVYLGKACILPPDVQDSLASGKTVQPKIYPEGTVFHEV